MNADSILISDDEEDEQPSTTIIAKSEPALCISDEEEVYSLMEVCDDDEPGAYVNECSTNLRDSDYKNIHDEINHDIGTSTSGNKDQSDIRKLPTTMTSNDDNPSKIRLLNYKLSPNKCIQFMASNFSGENSASFCISDDEDEPIITESPQSHDQSSKPLTLRNDDAGPSRSKELKTNNSDNSETLCRGDNNEETGLVQFRTANNPNSEISTDMCVPKTEIGEENCINLCMSDDEDEANIADVRKSGIDFNIGHNHFSSIRVLKYEPDPEKCKELMTIDSDGDNSVGGDEEESNVKLTMPTASIGNNPPKLKVEDGIHLATNSYSAFNVNNCEDVSLCISDDDDEGYTATATDLNGDPGSILTSANHSNAAGVRNQEIDLQQALSNGPVLLNAHNAVNMCTADDEMYADSAERPVSSSSSTISVPNEEDIKAVQMDIPIDPNQLKEEAMDIDVPQQKKTIKFKQESIHEKPDVQDDVNRVAVIESKLVHSQIEKKITFQCELCLSFFLEKEALAHHMSWHMLNVEQFICVACGESFNCAVSLEKHKECHHKEKGYYKCSLCDSHFDQEVLLETHTLKLHPEEMSSTLLGTFLCDTSSSLFNSEPVSYSHTDTDIDDEPFSCSMCPRTFTRLQQLDKHKRFHHRITYHKCEHCDKHFEQKLSLAVHIQTMHPIQTVYQCKLCQAQYHERIAFHMHLEKHARQHQRNTMECKLCEITFADNLELRHHMDKHMDRTPFQCDVCDVFLSSLNIKRCHLEIHFGEEPQRRIMTTTKRDEKIIKCKVCQKIFKTEVWLSKHMAIHRLHCSICDRDFKRNLDYAKHMKMHENETPKKSISHSCKICNKSFTQKNWLSNHMRTHTEAETPKPRTAAQGYKCKYCPKSFKQSNWLFAHTRSHSALKKQLFCKICRASFRSHKAFHEHKKVHNEKKSTDRSLDSEDPTEISETFKCPVCNQEFSNRIHLRTHLKVHVDYTRLQCKICEKRFERVCGLHVHLRMAHPYNGYKDEEPIATGLKIKAAPKGFQCYICCQSVVSIQRLQRHIRLHTLNPDIQKVRTITEPERPRRTIVSATINKQPPPVQQMSKSKQCHICNKRLLTHAALIYHLKRHRNERNYACKFCPSKFITKQQVDGHVSRLHSGNNLFYCSLCKRHLYRSNVFRSHMLKAHGVTL